jgi:hypothetical protein
MDSLPPFSDVYTTMSSASSTRLDSLSPILGRSDLHDFGTVSATVSSSSPLDDWNQPHLRAPVCY